MFYFFLQEIVECLKELEDLCSCSEDFRRLCSLLTLKRLSDYEDMKNWNPSSARVECFYKVLMLILIYNVKYLRFYLLFLNY